MKHLFSNVFNKHLYTFTCTFFFFLSVNFNAYAQSTVTAQCQNGLTMELTSDLTTSGTAIPFGTPITITTTVTNTGTTSQTVDLQLSLNPLSPAPHYDVLCADDYFGLNDLAQINSLNIDNTADAVGIGIKAIGNNFNQSFIYANNIKEIGRAHV